MSQKRTKQEIEQDYGQTCARAGHLQYQVSVLKKELDMVNDRLRDLNIEAANAKKEEGASLSAVPSVSKEEG